jgi:hypothetical protein
MKTISLPPVSIAGKGSNRTALQRLKTDPWNTVRQAAWGASSMILFQRVFATCIVFLVVGTVTMIQFDAQSRRSDMMWAFPAGWRFEDLHDIVPNFHHLWNSRNPALVHPPNDARLCTFGRDIVRYKDWKVICQIDSDKDGVTNGEEMGDPCCTWTPGSDRRKYRVWNLTHPGNPFSNLTKEELIDVTPQSCILKDEAEERLKHEQFQNQYYMKHETDLKTSDSLRWLKYPMICLMAFVIGGWAVKRGLLLDFVGVGPDAPGEAALSHQQRLLVAFFAYLWTDGIAGLTHLTFDFCPRDYPIIGNVAKGFQFHHYHPSAWVVVPFWQMMSHSVPLLGFLSCFLLVLRPSRSFRLFWTWTFILCFATVLSHRWCHIPPEELPTWYRVLQWSGILMTHEHHQAHHLSLVTQFSNLSGVTDFILDWLATNIIPAHQYQHWLSVTTVYFALPIVVGAEVVQQFLAQVFPWLMLNRSSKVAKVIDESLPYALVKGIIEQDSSSKLG